MATLPSGLSCDQSDSSAANLPDPKEQTEKAADPTKPLTAVFAGGCFWCVEAVFEQLDGVSSVVSGYAGGTESSAQYEAVSAGTTDHAEAVRITYDPERINFSQLLKVFFATHNPTQLNGQNPDWGRQYRSAVFYQNENEKQTTQKYIDQLTEATIFDKPIVTTLENLDKFYPAEGYHQDFVKRNPRHPYVLQWAIPKVKKVHKRFSDQVKADQ